LIVGLFKFLTKNSSFSHMSLRVPTELVCSPDPDQVGTEDPRFC